MAVRQLKQGDLVPPAPGPLESMTGEQISEWSKFGKPLSNPSQDGNVDELTGLDQSLRSAWRGVLAEMQRLQTDARYSQFGRTDALRAFAEQALAKLKDASDAVLSRAKAQIAKLDASLGLQLDDASKLPVYVEIRRALSTAPAPTRVAYIEASLASGDYATVDAILAGSPIVVEQLGLPGGADYLSSLRERRRRAAAPETADRLARLEKALAQVSKNVSLATDEIQDLAGIEPELQVLNPTGPTPADDAA